MERMEELEVEEVKKVHDGSGGGEELEVEEVKEVHDGSGGGEDGGDGGGTEVTGAVLVQSSTDWWM